jgi:hypothetical protein
MLRFWEVRTLDSERPVAWRFSLEDPHNGDKHAFADLQALIDFLKAELSQAESE